jgi:hypothetical protein
MSISPGTFTGTKTIFEKKFQRSHQTRKKRACEAEIGGNLRNFQNNSIFCDYVNKWIHMFKKYRLI